MFSISTVQQKTDLTSMYKLKPVYDTNINLAKPLQRASMWRFFSSFSLHFCPQIMCKRSCSKVSE